MLKAFNVNWETGLIRDSLGSSKTSSLYELQSAQSLLCVSDLSDLNAERNKYLSDSIAYRINRITCTNSGSLTQWWCWVKCFLVLCVCVCLRGADPRSVVCVTAVPTQRWCSGSESQVCESVAWDCASVSARARFFLTAVCVCVHECVLSFNGDLLSLWRWWVHVDTCLLPNIPSTSLHSALCYSQDKQTCVCVRPLELRFGLPDSHLWSVLRLAVCFSRLPQGSSSKIPSDDPFNVKFLPVPANWPGCVATAVTS